MGKIGALIVICHTTQAMQATTKNDAQIISSVLIAVLF
jgi:hypothetical protein